MTTRKEKIIVVIEDSGEDFETIEWLLKKTGYEFVLKRFEFADDAIDYLKNNPPPVFVLLDLNLNGTDGHETLKTIKEDEKWCLIPVIILTTSTDPKDIEFCYRNGTAGYFHKPVNFEKFGRSLQILMDYWLYAVILR